MAQLTEYEAARLEWEFVRQRVGWWRRRRIENRPAVRLVTPAEVAQVGVDMPDTWFVSFPRKTPFVDCDPDLSTLGVRVEDRSGRCEWTVRL